MDEMSTITTIKCDKWHLKQSKEGHKTYGNAGIPGIGIKRAVSLMDEHGYSWETVVKAFKDKGLTEDDALINARLARILTCTDYDQEKKTVIPWTPSADYRIDDGAGVQVEEA
jgi:DNA polymerase-1